MESGGAMGKALQEFLRALRDLHDAGSDEPSTPIAGSTWANRTFMPHWVQRLSCVFQKTTADGLIARAQRLARRQGEGFYPPGGALPVFRVEARQRERAEAAADAVTTASVTTAEGLEGGCSVLSSHLAHHHSQHAPARQRLPPTPALDQQAPKLGRGLGSQVVLMDDACKDQEEAAEFLKMLASS